MGTLIGLAFAGVMAFLFFFIIILIVLYVLGSVGLFKIAKKEDNDLYWLAWIPIANMFLMAMLVEEDVHESLKGKYTMIYGIVLVSSFFISIFYAPFAFLPLAMMLYAFYFIANRYSTNGIVHLVLSAVTLGLAIPFQLFRFRNREPLIQ